MRETDEVEPFFLAGAPAEAGRVRSATGLRPFADDDHQFLVAKSADTDFFLAQRDEDVFEALDRVLRRVRPQVVHFQHLLFFGVDAIRHVRATLGGVAIVLTLQEYLYLCAAEGQLLRRHDGTRCLRASPQRCHECLPAEPPESFLRRERFIKAHLGQVDRFVAPSRFLLERYAEWGLPREKMVLLDYGRREREPLPPRPRAPGEGPARFGFFGQLTPYKGADVLLAAIARLRATTPDVRLYLNGANLDLQPADFQQRLRGMLAACGSAVTDLGPYSHADLAERMALVDWVVVPSLWWENSPLVIQEAFLHGRPVICANVGGMAEKVRDGVDGIHFRCGDADDLAATLARASRDGELWQRLRAAIARPLTLADAVDAHRAIYRGLLAGVVPLREAAGA